MKNTPDEANSSKTPLARARSASMPDISFRKEPTNTEEIKAVPLTRLQKLKKLKIVTSGSKLLHKASNKWDQFGNTTPGKFVKITNGLAVSRITSVVLASLTIAGLLSPASPAIALAIGIMGLASVAVGIVMDTARTRTTRLLQKENKLLVDNATARNVQDTILKANPKLKETLGDVLYSPDLGENKKSKTKGSATKHSKRFMIGEQVGKAFLKHAIKLALIVLKAIVTTGANILKEIGKAAINLLVETNTNLSINTIRAEFKQQIDQQRNNPATPGYDNLTELKQITRLQRIQTMALQQLVTDPKYGTMNDAEKKTAFQTYQQNIEQKVKAMSAPKNIFVKSITTMWSIIKDGGRAHNPFSEYNNPSKIKIDRPPELKKAVQKHPTFHSAKDALQRNKDFEAQSPTTSVVQQRSHKKSRSRSVSI